MFLFGLCEWKITNIQLNTNEQLCLWTFQAENFTLKSSKYLRTLSLGANIRHKRVHGFYLNASLTKIELESIFGITTRY